MEREREAERQRRRERQRDEDEERDREVGVNAPSQLTSLHFLPVALHLEFLLIPV